MRISSACAVTISVSGRSKSVLPKFIVNFLLGYLKSALQCKGPILARESQTLSEAISATFGCRALATE